MAVPPLWVFTDPGRIPDPVAAARTLPRGAVLVYRPFGAADALAIALALNRIARSRRLMLLIGGDAKLAGSVRAHGVHLPERALHLAPGLRRRSPRWLISGAAHDARALTRAARMNLHVAVLSKALPSRSASSAPVLGATRTAALIRCARLPVVALGGVTGRTAHRLRRSGAAGLAMVEGAEAFSAPPPGTR